MRRHSRTWLVLTPRPWIKAWRVTALPPPLQILRGRGSCTHSHRRSAFKSAASRPFPIADRRITRECMNRPTYVLKCGTAGSLCDTLRLVLGRYARTPPSADRFFDPSCWNYGYQIQWMGYTVRSADFRFTRWHQWNGTGLCPLPSRNESSLVELYDHRDDTSIFDLDAAEYQNVAAGNAEAVARLGAVLDTKVTMCGGH